ncbi:uncharacterized protein si:ch1073-83n3.2 isoform X1 [Ctenopharyngodon idella]|uniref:uncharacterized protein si:ch1073-83n3.2 isoform X1 n=1 Tax=Ctenopharyngodon idella TaxID=7959 RepID=UPI0022318CDD|nr:uncharacterized protein si:ch1073-83n3.2 isoform X1 [Ctenopharyngodon idella]
MILEHLVFPNVIPFCCHLVRLYMTIHFIYIYIYYFFFFFQRTLYALPINAVKMLFYTGPNSRIILDECYIIYHVAVPSPDPISMISVVISHERQPNTLPSLIFGLERLFHDHSAYSIFAHQWHPLFAQGVTSPLALKRQQSITPCITDREPLPDISSEKEPTSPHLSDKGLSSPRVRSRENSFRHRGSINQRPPCSPSVAPPLRSADCLRHGNSSDARAVRAVCLLMGGAAASSALGYLNSCPPTSSNMAAHNPEMTHSTAFSEMGGGSSYHACSQAIESPHFNSFDFEGDSDFDAFDCGGFAF